MATGGATLTPGQQADLFLVRLNNSAAQPTDDVSNLVYATHGEAVCLTIVDGKIVYRNGV
jgi:cytosine/adenosine deaminase-related metal-dependent hydrolase